MTVSVLATVFCAAVGIFLRGEIFPFAPASITSVVVMLAVLLPVWAAPFAITGYEVRGGALLVKRPFWTTRIPLAGLGRAELDAAALKRSWRICGNGGLFSFTGWFSSPALGIYRAFLTDPKRPVILRFQEKKIAVSPEDPEAFCDAVLRARTGTMDTLP